MSNLDSIENYISKKDMVYIALDNKVMWYESPSNRKVDARWFTATLSEVARIIRCTTLSNNVTEEEVLQVLQELDVVFEIAVESRFNTRKGVYNLSRGEVTELEEVVRATMEVLSDYSDGYLLTQVNDLINEVSAIKGIKVNHVERKSLINKYADYHDYEVRVNERRITRDNKKVSVLLKYKSKPSCIKVLRNLNREVSAIIKLI